VCTAHNSPAGCALSNKHIYCINQRRAMHQLLLCIFCVLDILNKCTPLIKSPSVNKYISEFVYIHSICNKRMYTLYITARCVNTAGYINLGSHWLTNHIHMFPMSHTLSKSVNILQRRILRILTYSTHDQQLENNAILLIESNRSELPLTVSGVARLCTRLRRTHVRGK
jgi:hypothetical protein